MSVVDWIEKHRRSLLFVAIALTTAGTFAGVGLPVSLFPVVKFPRVRVVIDSGSMPAKQMLVEVTEPLEEVGRAVPGATDVESTTSRGSAEIFIDFPWSVDIRRALLAVQGAFAQKIPDLPPGTNFEVEQMSPNVKAPVVSYALTSKRVPLSSLRQLAQYEIVPLLTGIAGVRHVGVIGGHTREVQVYLNPQKLRGYGLTMKDVEGAISETNTLGAVGKLVDNDLMYLMIANGAFKNVDSVKNVILRTPKGGLVRLGDIADIKMGAVPQWLLVNDDGRPAVTFDVYQQDTANAVELAKRVSDRLKAFMRTQPKSIRLAKWYDQTQLVKSSIEAVEESILIGLVFSGLVILAFLRNWRATLVAMLVVPMSVLITCAVLMALGMTFNIITLGGIAAAIGLLIDDVIVMIEQIARCAGVPEVSEAKRTVLASAKEFLAPLTGSSLATIVMFVPLAFLTGVTGAFFKFLSLTMASALIISYALTAIIVPLLAHSLIDFTKWHDPAHGRETWSVRVHGRVLQALSRRPWIVGAGLAALVCIGYLGYAHVRTGFLPKMDEGGFILEYTAAPGTSLAETNRELEEVEAIIKKNPYVKNYSRRIGAGLGGDFVEAFQGDIFVQLIDPSKRPSIWHVMDEVNDEIGRQVPGLDFDTHQLMGDIIGDMVGRRQPVVVELRAKDPTILPQVAVKVAGAIAKVPGIEPASVLSGLQPSGAALDIHINPDAAAANDITPAEARSQLTRYLKGTVTTRYLATIQDVEVRLWAAPSNAERILRTDLGNVPLRGSDGHLVTLASIARIKFASGQYRLTRDNLVQVVPVTADIGGGYDLGSTIVRVKAALNRPELLPNGVYYRLGGEYKQQQIAARGMMKVFAAVVVAEIVLLLFLYESLLLSIIIIVTSLISTGAVFAGLWVTGIDLNITAMMGMVMILGIATEMAIFLVSEYRVLERSMPHRLAIRAAALNRLRPITMSTLAMILALLPLGLAISGSGDQMLQPLAIAIIAGITVQLPLVLAGLPVLISLTAKLHSVPHAATVTLVSAEAAERAD